MSGEWRPIHTAPRDREILLYARGGVYVGKLRHGALGEPQQQHFGWRAYCCGRWSDPSHWMPLPAPPRSITERLPESEKTL